MRIVVMVEETDTPKTVVDVIKCIVEAVPAVKTYIAQDHGSKTIGWEISAIEALEALKRQDEGGDNLH